MAITVRELVTKLTVKGNAMDKLAKFGLAVGGVRAGLGIMVGAMKIASRATFGLVDDVTKLGDSVAKTARAVGLGAKEYQRLKFAADRSGIGMRNLDLGLKNIQKSIRDASIAAGKGKKDSFATALNEVGLELKDLKNLNAEEQIGLLGEALSSVADKGRRLALSQELIGERAGPKFASLLAEGTAGIKALGDEAERLGLVLDEDALDASEDFQDSLTNMRATLTGVKNVVGITLLPTIKKGVDGFTKWTVANREFIKLKFEKVVEFLSDKFNSLLKNIDGITDGFGSLVDGAAGVMRFFSDLAEAVGGVTNLIKLATAGWVAFKVAQTAALVGVSLSPLGLLFIALTAIAVAFNDIETSAEAAERATKRFGASQGSQGANFEIDEGQATRDAAAIARSAGSGKEVDPKVRARLLSGDQRQSQRAFDIARKIQAGRLTSGGGLATVRSGALAQKAGPRSRRLLQLIEDDIAESRARALRAESARSAEPEPVFGIAGLPGFGPDISGSGRTFASISAPGKDDKGPSLDELISEAIKSGKLPEEAALLASTQPPIIIPITNNNITVNVDAPTTIEGASAENAEDFRQIAREEFDNGLVGAVREAMDELRPQLAR